MFDTQTVMTLVSTVISQLFWLGNAEKHDQGLDYLNLILTSWTFKVVVLVSKITKK